MSTMKQSSRVPPRAAKEPPRGKRPEAGQVFSTFVRNLEQLGKASRLPVARAKGRSA